jgi:hypothetical protein
MKGQKRGHAGGQRRAIAEEGQASPPLRVPGGEICVAHSFDEAPLIRGNGTSIRETVRPRGLDAPYMSDITSPIRFDPQLVCVCRDRGGAACQFPSYALCCRRRFEVNSSTVPRVMTS